MVDLRRPYPLSQIKIFLRKGLESRNRRLNIYTSLDLVNWIPLGSPEIKETDVIQIDCDCVLSRFVKIEVKNNVLHLRKVEIYSDTNLIPFRGYLVTDDDSVSRAVMGCVKNGDYEAAKIDLTLANLSYGDRVLELGASLGLVSLVALKEHKAQRYFAVEANPNLIEIIRNNHHINNVSCNIINAAIAHENGNADFYIHRDSWASSLTPFKDPIKIVKIPTRNFS